MIYSYNKFLKTLTETDKVIKIFDNNGVVTHTINPFSILDLIISNNILKINLRSKRIISLSFSTIDESKLAIFILREQIEQLKSKVPGFIDKQIENYVEDKISTVDVNWGNGLTYNGGTVSVGGTLTNTLFLSGDYNDFIGVGFDNFSVTASIFDIVSDFVSIDSTDSLQILADNDLTILSNNQLTLIGDSALVSVANSEGLVYSSDYSSGFTDRSLVDKEYVDNSIKISNSDPLIYRSKLRSEEFYWPGYGFLYNWYVIDDSRGICNPNGGTNSGTSSGTSSGTYSWRVSSDLDWQELITFVGPNSEVKLKSKIELSNGYDYYGWIVGLKGTDDYNFNSLPSGSRATWGTFYNLTTVSYWWVTSESSNNVYSLDSYFNNFHQEFNNGYSIRLVREATPSELLLEDGYVSDESNLNHYIGNDGKIYTTVKIGNQIWINQNLRETLYSNLKPILNLSTEYGDIGDSSWIYLTEGAYTNYNISITKSAPYDEENGLSKIYNEIIQNDLVEDLIWYSKKENDNIVYISELFTKKWGKTFINVTPAYDISTYLSSNVVIQKSLLVKSIDDFKISFLPIVTSYTGVPSIQNLNNYTNSNTDSFVYIEILSYKITESGSGSGSDGIGLDLLN